MAIVVIPFYGRVFNRAVHALDLSVRPRVVWLGQAMLNAICSANDVKPHVPGIGGVPVAGLLTKLDAVVRKDCAHLVWNGFQHGLEKLTGCLAVCFVDQLRNSKLAGLINIYEEIQLTLIGTKLSDINMEIANRISFELLPLGVVALHIWQSRNAMPLQTALQGRACQVWDRRLQGIETQSSSGSSV